MPFETETHSVVRLFFASPLPCADGERGCFREAEVENERLERAGGEITGKASHGGEIVVVLNWRHLIDHYNAET